MKKYHLMSAVAVSMGLIAGCTSSDRPDETFVHQLEVTPQSLDFDSDNQENNVFTITSNVPWKISADEGLKLDKYDGGEGQTAVAVLEAPAGKTCTAKVSTVKWLSSETSVSRTITVKGPSAGGDEPVEYEESIVFYDNLGGASPEEPYLDGWSENGRTATGSGADAIRYEGRGVKVTSYVTSSGYPEASGGRAIQFWSGQTLSIKNISLPRNVNTYRFSFGLTGGRNVSLSSSSVSLSVVNEKGVGKQLVCELEKYGDWYLVKSCFHINGTVPETMAVVVTVSTTKMRLDDPELVTTTAPAEQTIDFGPSETNRYTWAELPKTNMGNGYEYVENGGRFDDFKYVTHYATTYSSKKYVRNYSACYDTRRHNPMWVAYPFHAIYEEGGWTRPDVDPWRNDPEFDETEQSIIYPADWRNYPDHTDQRRWSKLDGMTDYFGRGHLLMSANRGAGSRSALLELNTQTFYPTNISPEYHLYPKHWELVEERLTRWNCSDTVYVVTGCHYENDDNVIKDASWSGYWGEESKDCVVPTAHYKVFLRTKSGNSGKPVQECSADELMAIGFWFEQKLDSTPFAEQPALSTVTMSVSEIESRLGSQFEFFPGVPSAVKASYSISDWPGLSEISSTVYPPYK